MYALSAIPIWMLKMATTLAGLGIMIHKMKAAIGYITGKFEDLLYMDFSALFSGNKKNADTIVNYDGNTDSFNFFPSVSSPFFILWIVFLSAAVLIMLFGIIIALIKRMMDEEADSKRLAVVGVSSIASIFVGIFFIPIVVFTSMTLSSVGLKMLFKTGNETTSSAAIQEYKSTYLSKLTQISQQIYNVGNQNNLSQNDGAINALYSHTTSNYTDKIDYKSNQIPAITRPFTDTKSIFERLSLELSHLEKDPEKISESIKLDISQTKQAIDQYIEKWYSKKQIKDVLDKLVKGTTNVSLSNKDASAASILDEQTSTLSSFVTQSTSIFNHLRKIIANIDSIKYQIELQGANELGKKLTTLFSNLNQTENTKFIYNTDVKIGGNKKDDVIKVYQKAAALSNIYSLTKVYIAPSSFTNKADWEGKFLFNKNIKYASHETLMDLIQNAKKMLYGYRLSDNKTQTSLLGIAYTYSSHKKTSLEEVISDISSYGGTNPIVRIIMMFVTWGVITLIMAILYQLVKRLLERLLKLMFLWIVGAFYMISSLNKGTYSMKTWFSQVFLEVAVLIGLGLGWELWKLLTPILFDWVAPPHKTGNTFFLGGGIGGIIIDTITPSLGIIFFKIFISVGLLELVVKTSDWLAQFLGGNSSISSIKQNVAGKSIAIGKSVANRSKTNFKNTSRNRLSTTNWDKSRGMKISSRSKKGGK